MPTHVTRRSREWFAAVTEWLMPATNRRRLWKERRALPALRNERSLLAAVGFLYGVLY
jgi:hypothetical protein